MAKKKSAKKNDAKKFNKTYVIFGILAAIIVILVVVIVAINLNPKIESSYFHTTDGKIVLTMEDEMFAPDESEWEAPIVHVVYYYGGEKVSGVKIFYEYENEATAKEAYENLEISEFAEGKSLNGRFIVMVARKEFYEDVLVSELKENVEVLEQSGALILDYDE